jgi:hypothetical protein
MTPTSKPRRLVSVARVMLVADLVVCLTALLLIPLTGVETVLLTGPILFISGLVTATVAGNSRYGSAMWVGIAHCGVCLLFVVLVNTLDWSPREAIHPFEAIGSFFSSAIGGAMWMALRRAPREREPWTCVGCGYLLYGLIEPRCPECGLKFDPAEFAGHPAATTFTGLDPNRPAT